MYINIYNSFGSQIQQHQAGSGLTGVGMGLIWVLVLGKLYFLPNFTSKDK